MDTSPSERNLGSQPLDALLQQLEIGNHELVEASTEQLTHKQVQKARKGRRLTSNLQRKITRALNAACRLREREGNYGPGDLFNYRG